MRRRVGILLLLLAAVLCLGAVPVHAAESHPLLPEKAFWRGFPEGGSYLLLQEDMGEFLFYSSGKSGKPATQTLYQSPMEFSAEGNSLVYYFTVEQGSCSVEFLFAGEDGETVYRFLGDALRLGTMQGMGSYKGVLSLDAFGQGTLSFLGVRITCAEGGKLSVKTLSVMQTAEVPEDAWEAVSTEESSEEASSTPESSAEETQPEESSRHSIFMPKEETSFSQEELIVSFTIMTAVSFLAIFLGIFICVTLFRRSRLD